MRRLTEIKGDEALDLFADLLDPVTEIFADKEVSLANDKGTIEAIKVAIKNHKKAVKTIIALINEEDSDTYEPSVAVIPATLYQIVTDADLLSLFTSQGQKINKDTSGSVTENTEGEE